MQFVVGTVNLAPPSWLWEIGAVPAAIVGVLGILVLLYGGQRLYLARTTQSPVGAHGLSRAQQILRGAILVCAGTLLLAKALGWWDPAQLIWQR